MCPCVQCVDAKESVFFQRCCCIVCYIIIFSIRPVTNLLFLLCVCKIQTCRFYGIRLPDTAANEYHCEFWGAYCKRDTECCDKDKRTFYDISSGHTVYKKEGCEKTCFDQIRVYTTDVKSDRPIWDVEKVELLDENDQPIRIDHPIESGHWGPYSAHAMFAGKEIWGGRPAGGDSAPETGGLFLGFGYSSTAIPASVRLDHATRHRAVHIVVQGRSQRGGDVAMVDDDWTDIVRMDEIGEMDVVTIALPRCTPTCLPEEGVRRQTCLNYPFQHGYYNTRWKEGCGRYHQGDTLKD